MGEDRSTTVDHEVERTRRTLAAMVRLRGMTLQDLDQRTGHQRGYYSQILGGRLALRYRHVVEVLEVLGIDRQFFFRMVYPTAEELAQGGEIFRLLGYDAEGKASAVDAADTAPVRDPEKPTKRSKAAASAPATLKPKGS
jgi:hypothetical protein